MKTCFKCGDKLPLTEFYHHQGMSDGHLNKCKSCTKADTKEAKSKRKANLETITPEMAKKMLSQDKSKKSRPVKIAGK